MHLPNKNHCLIKTIVARCVTSLMLILAFITLFFFFPSWVFSAVSIVCLLYVVCFELPKLKPQCTLFWFSVISMYLCIPVLILITINSDASHRLLIPITIMLTASCDIGAYCAGTAARLYHWTTPLAPSISPQKTWQGICGGYVATVGTALCLLYLGKGRMQLSIPFFLIVTLIFMCAVIGDLFESLLKRQAQIKDISTLLPGHGGMLDRIDSILPTLYILYFFKHMLAHTFLVFYLGIYIFQ